MRTAISQNPFTDKTIHIYSFQDSMESKQQQKVFFFEKNENEKKQNYALKYNNNW